MLPFLRRKNGAQYKESPIAPSVAIAVQMPKLPAPPYQEFDEKPQKKQKIIKPTPVTVKVGQEYRFITTGIIAMVRVEKIWQDEDGNTYVVISQLQGNGRMTHAIHIGEFRQRVIAGGVQEVVIN